MNNNIFGKALTIIRTEGLLFMVKKILAKIPLKVLLLPFAIIKLKNVRLLNLSELTKFCFDDVFGLIKPQQFQSEILGLITVVKGIKPRTVIEIGTSRGGTLFLLCHAAAEDATVISIDFPDRRFGGCYPLWKIPLYKAFKLPKQKLHLVRADSHKPETLARVKDLLDGEKAGFIFIDGDHSYEGVRQDFEMYSQLLREKGLIAFHDIVVHPVETGCGVSKLWDELKQHGNKYEEIVADVNQDWGGIGVLHEYGGQ
jgi:predicted O-methyltransferase YrrM